jgi:hypothetical protein
MNMLQLYCLLSVYILGIPITLGMYVGSNPERNKRFYFWIPIIIIFWPVVVLYALGKGIAEEG